MLLGCSSIPAIYISIYDHMFSSFISTTLPCILMKSKSAISFHKIHKIKPVEKELELDSNKQVLLAVASLVISNAIKILARSLPQALRSEEVVWPDLHSSWSKRLLFCFKVPKLP